MPDAGQHEEDYIEKEMGRKAELDEDNNWRAKARKNGEKKVDGRRHVDGGWLIVVGSKE